MQKQEPRILIPEWESEPHISPRPSVQWFAAQMESRLMRNSHKGGWLGGDFSMKAAVYRAKAEIRELEWEMRCATPGRYFIGDRPRALIFHESADAANFLMMVADRARRGLP